MNKYWRLPEAFAHIFFLFLGESLTYPPFPRGEGTPYNSLPGEVSPKRGTFFRRQEYERVRISLVKRYKRVGISVISVLKKRRKSRLTDAFKACERHKKSSSWFKETVNLHQLKGIQGSDLVRYIWKECHFSRKDIRKGYLFPSKRGT